jgi:hypothetical protein
LLFGYLFSVWIFVVRGGGISANVIWRKKYEKGKRKKRIIKNARKRRKEKRKRTKNDKRKGENRK